MYGVAVADVQIGGGIPRIEKQGYCAFITMKHIWEFNVVANAADLQKILDHQDTQNLVPYVLISRVQDNR